MKTHKMKLVAWLFVLALFIPQSSQAYFTTAQSATKLSADTFLFTISYKFGFQNRGLYMPIMAVRDNDATSSPTRAEYAILQDGAVISAGLSNAIVLTNDSAVVIKDGQYYLPPGKTATYTLVTLLTIPQTEQDQLSLLMTHLPFTFLIDGAKSNLQLNPTELQYYRTPAVE